jgi:hypothetical protein
VTGVYHKIQYRSILVINYLLWHDANSNNFFHRIYLPPYADETLCIYLKLVHLKVCMYPICLPTRVSKLLKFQNISQTWASNLNSTDFRSLPLRHYSPSLSSPPVENIVCSHIVCDWLFYCRHVSEELLWGKWNIIKIELSCIPDKWFPGVGKSYLFPFACYMNDVTSSSIWRNVFNFVTPCKKLGLR